MATALEPYLDRDELFIDRYERLEWVDDVTQFQCTRCRKVLVQHYIADCDHKFCNNCKRVVDDGSHRWRCPKCNQFIRNIGRQDPVFKDRVRRLRLHCINRKYGCPHISRFKDIKEHLEGCEFTKEKALPVLYLEGPTVEMLDRMFTAQLLNLRNEMKRKWEEQKGVNEGAWDMSIILRQMKREMMEQMREEMLEMNLRQKDGEDKIMELTEKTTRLENEISDLQKRPIRSDALERLSLVVEENKFKILKLEAKSESYYEMIDFNNRKNNELIQQLKNEVDKELKTFVTKSEMDTLKQTTEEMALEQNKKWAENKDEVSGVIETIKKERERRIEVTSSAKKNSSQILELNGKVESLGKDLHVDLQNQVVQVEQKIKESEVRLKRKLIEETSKIVKLESKTNVQFQSTEKQFKTEIIKIKKEMEKCEEEELKIREDMTSAESKNSSQMLTLNERIESLEKQLSNVNRKCETLEETVNEVKESRLAQERKLAEVDDRINTVALDKQKVSPIFISDELSALKKKVKETEEEIRLFTVLSPAATVCNSIIRPELQHLRRVGEYYKEEPDFTWTVGGMKSFIGRRSTGGSSTGGSSTGRKFTLRLFAGSKKELSEVFPLRGYPCSAQVKMELNGDRIRFSLCFKDTNKTNNEIVMKPMASIYFTWKDQSENKERKDRIRIYYFRYFIKEFKFNVFYDLYVESKSIFTSPLYMVDDKVVIDIHVEAPEVAQSVYSYDGTLTWAIHDFRKRKQMEVEKLMKFHLSPYFYTSPKGYRVQVITWLNGCSEYKNKGVSVHIRFLDGLHDEDLDEKFKHKATVTIFHPTQPTRNISKSKESDNISWDMIDMGSPAEIENLLHNDTLYYKVTVEILNPK